MEFLNHLHRDLSDKDREMIARIDEVRCEVASMWEDRLLYVQIYTLKLHELELN